MYLVDVVGRMGGVGSKTDISIFCGISMYPSSFPADSASFGATRFIRQLAPSYGVDTAISTSTRRELMVEDADW